MRPPRRWRMSHRLMRVRDPATPGNTIPIMDGAGTTRSEAGIRVGSKADLGRAADAALSWPPSEPSPRPDPLARTIGPGCSKERHDRA